MSTYETDPGLKPRRTRSAYEVPLTGPTPLQRSRIRFAWVMDGQRWYEKHDGSGWKALTEAELTAHDRRCLDLPPLD